MTRLFVTLALTIALAVGRAQSFEGIIHYEVTSDSPGAFSIGIEHSATLTIRDGNIHTVLKSKREGQIEKVYLARRDSSYQIDHIRQRYVSIPRPPRPEIKVMETSGTKKILGHKCKKYVSEKTAGGVFIFWVTDDPIDVNCELIAEDLDFVPCKQLQGMPLMIETTMPNGSYKIEITEIKQRKVPDWYFDLNKEYTIEEAPLKRVDH